MADPKAATASAPSPAPAGARSERSRLRLRVIGCEVLARPLYLAAARSRHVVDVSFLRRGLHDVPVTLREQLQGAIDAAAGESTYDAIVLAYGLCGGATAGIHATRLPLVVPRAHDCITLFLGSRERYDREVLADPGTYWYSADYLERTDPGQDGAPGGLLGIGASSDEQLAAAYDEYVRKFGKDNADYLIEVLGTWREHYDRGVFIDLGLGDPNDVEGNARAEAARRGWRFERMAGQLELFCRLLDGEWADDALVLQPGQRLAMSYDGSIIGPAEGEG